jgi:hypothetical protein
MAVDVLRDGNGGVPENLRYDFERYPLRKHHARSGVPRFMRVPMADAGSGAQATELAGIDSASIESAQLPEGCHSISVDRLGCQGGSCQEAPPVLSTSTWTFS